MMQKQVATFAATALFGLALAACNEGSTGSRHWVPLSGELQGLMAEKGMTRQSPILIRSFKKEAEMEIWKQGADGKYALLKTFPICRWSGQLGPKIREGDRQAPEGFYQIAPAQMNPNSAFHLSFDTGFPNTFDRQLGRTGSALMVHGACSSRGCFSMTDKQIEDIYALVREAHSGGQRGVQMQSFPFRMTAENLAKHRFDPHIGFWKQLKEGNDYFEVSHTEPKVNVCGGRYTFNTNGTCDPASIPSELRAAVASKRAQDEARVAELVAKGTPAVRVQYADGGQHQSFRNTSLAYAAGAGSESPILALHAARSPGALAEVSRPDAIDAQQEIALGPDGKPMKQVAAVPAASAKPAVAATQTAKPAAATQIARQPASTATAPAAAAAFAPQPAADQAEKSMFNRLLGSVGLGGKEEAAPAEVEAPPVPPRRASAGSQKTSDAAPKVIPGAQGTVAAGFARYDQPAR